jgi:O-antigen biosynthesis protein
MSLWSFLHQKNTTSPSEAELRLWASSEWIEYQAWLFHHAFISLNDWQQRHQRDLRLKSPLHFSIITPVYNTQATQLRECLYSVMTQTYPYWELCLVDDGSNAPETLELLHDVCPTDTRLRLHTLPHNQGICAATNQALAMAQGDYVAFLDHDDRLAPHALSCVAELLQSDTTIDVVYSDRDMLSPSNLRFMHLFKPDWSPETLLSGNYLFHLLVYRRSLLQQLGGVRPEFEGSQDYDLILRAADSGAHIRHLAQILYHWRQHPQSVSFAHESKTYAYHAGLRALQESLQRRGLRGTVEENSALWRGNYRVRLEALPPQRYRIIHAQSWQHWDDSDNLRCAAENDEWLILLGPGVQALDADSIAELSAWLALPEIMAVTGKVINEQGNLCHAGLVMRGAEVPLSLYHDHPENTYGYMAATASLRNVSLPHPACCALKSGMLQEGINDAHARGLRGAYALLHAILKSTTPQRRVVYNPHARFCATAGWQWPQQWPQAQHFCDIWQAWTNDPYYNPYLTTHLEDMGLDMDKWRKTLP